MIFNKTQVSLNAAETLCGKHRMEEEALQQGVTISGYKTDNGVYKSKAFLDDLKK